MAAEIRDGSARRREVRLGHRALQRRQLPDLLAALPKLPTEFEYRFVGDRLILLDKHAHLIVDWVDNVLPIKPQEAETR